MIFNMKNFWIVLILLGILAVPSLAYAQDAIVKKDGNTVVCRIVKFDKSQVTYKRWTDLQGSNYMMNVDEISTIIFETGEKQIYNVSENPALPQFNTSQRYVDDAVLLQIASEQERKAKRGKIIGCSIMTLGTIGLITSAILSDNSNKTALIQSCGFGGLTLMAVGGIWWISSNRISKKHMLGQSALDIQTSPILQKEIRFNNGSTFSASLVSINNQVSPKTTIGLGFSLKF